MSKIIGKNYCGCIAICDITKNENLDDKLK